ncbi:MAG: helix-turn-helix transcriptional regulator [Bacteroidota bacterium]
MGKKNIITLGERIRSLRTEAGQSLKEVADAIGMDASLLGKIERDERAATREQIRQFAAFFKVSEKLLLKEYLSDQIAYKLIDEDADPDTLRVAEAKMRYYKTSRKK